MKACVKKRMTESGGGSPAEPLRIETTDHWQPFWHTGNENLNIMYKDMYHMHAGAHRSLKRMLETWKLGSQKLKVERCCLSSRNWIFCFVFCFKFQSSLIQVYTSFLQLSISFFFWLETSFLYISIPVPSPHLPA